MQTVLARWGGLWGSEASVRVCAKGFRTLNYPPPKSALLKYAGPLARDVKVVTVASGPHEAVPALCECASRNYGNHGNYIPYDGQCRFRSSTV